jgi:hypothetical protein
MPYDTSVTMRGNHAYRLLRDEQRLRLAHDALGRVLRKDGTVHASDLPRAGFSDLLAEFWMCYGWQERRRLARARTEHAAFLDVVLIGAGYSTTQVSEGVLRVDSAALRGGLDRLASADELRAGARKWRIDEVRKGRTKRKATANGPTLVSNGDVYNV